MEEGENVDQRKAKKPRHRMKSLYTNIRNQMEFYFSDANLHKDRFLKKAIEATSDGYIALDTFLGFNKMKSLTSDMHMLAEALHDKSDMLQVNEEKTHVRRTTPISEPVNVDERTVYVECLPHGMGHDWVRRVFSPCGKVVYVSLPRYNSTGDMKGFGFVEFETVEGAEAACKELNNPPANFSHRVGMFPKSSHQLEAIKKKLPTDQIIATEEKAKGLLVSEEMVEGDAESKVNGSGNKSEKGKKRKTETDEMKASKNDSKSEKNENQTGSSKSETVGKAGKSKRRRTNSETVVDSETAESPMKRKKSEVSFNVPDKDKESNAEDEGKSTSGGKKRAKKRKSRSKTSDDSVNTSKDESGTEKSSEGVPAKKVKIDTDSANEPSEKSGSEMESATENIGIDKENKTKKKRRRRKKSKSEKEVPELRVIAKKEWLVLREEYLKLQKASMAMLKKTLKPPHTESKHKEGDKDSKERKEIEFLADVIVKVSSEQPLKRKDLKASLGEEVQVAYIDIGESQTEGFIRCKDTTSARTVADKQQEGVKFSLITGDEEKQYWDKLTADREAKLGNKCRNKRRGQQKWMEKAQKASVENWERKHIVFDDE
ncbi:la-related protein 7-like [Mya arenaria]|uniref:la-related protein 7-like n=1 Tax=Mya arenaria TaxID=6604 RepID=UPI0022E1BDA9|nr:la-related protein 7-like [Mya arenaria]XP_052818955.1 la-related protein 7-like [Mya arenaria]